MADCCVNGLNQVFCNAFNKYYNTLYTNGEISQEETNNLLIIDYIRQCLSDDRYNSYYNILLKALRCIANNSCLLDTSWLYDRSIVPKVTNLFVTVLTKQAFTETDPIFSASPAATITEEDIDNWNNSSGGELSDWDETDIDSLAYIKNKPTIPTVPTNVSAFNNDAGYLTQHQSIKTVNNTSLVGNGNIDLVPTETFNNFCPTIKDTRSSAVAAITGVAPFASLVDGQRIMLFLANYYNALNPTLTLTLSGGGQTSAIPIYAQTAGSNTRPQAATMAAGAYFEMVYVASNNHWQVVGKDTNTTYGSLYQNEINAGTSTTTKVVTPKVFHDNAYIVEESYSSGSLKANKMYNFGTVSSLTIPSLDATNDLVSNALNFYALRFIAGADDLNITFPTGVIVDDEPTINTGDYVEIMINLYVENNTNHFYASIKVWQAQ